MSFNKSAADVLFMSGEYEKACDAFRRGAEEGSDIAAYNYAYCLLNGIGTERDPALAKSFFTFARDMEGGESCYNLAVMHLNGIGVQRDLRAALQYMSDSADLGCVEAMLYLGMSYTIGYLMYPEITGICMIPYHKPEIRAEGLPMLEGGVSEALRQDEEERSTVIRDDARRAFEYFSEAATADPTYVEELVAKGRFLFARCFIDGHGVEMNRDIGTRLMISAGKLGSMEAVSYLAENGVSQKLLAEAGIITPGE